MLRKNPHAPNDRQRRRFRAAHAPEPESGASAQLSVSRSYRTRRSKASRRSRSSAPITKSSVIFSQGDEGDALFGVASGRVRISASASGGREVFLNIMEPGDTFGEIAVMDGLPRTANAMALDTSTLIVIQRADFLPFLEREPLLAIHLLKLMCERLRWTSELVEESAFMARTRAARETTADSRVVARPRGARRSPRAADLAGGARALPRHLAPDRQSTLERLAPPRLDRARPHADRDPQHRRVAGADRRGSKGLERRSAGDQHQRPPK